MKYFAVFALLAIGLAQAAPTSDVWELFKVGIRYTEQDEDIITQC